MPMLVLLRCRRVRMALLSVVVLGSTATQATTVLPMTFSQVVAGAEVIAIGVVSAVEATWDAEREMPFTEVTVSDIDVVKGQVVNRALTLRFLGGPAPNGLTLEVSGMPQFAPAQQVVVFSTRDDGRPCPLVGWWQGLYRIVYDAERDARTVVNHAGRPVTAIEGDVGQRVVRLSAASGAPAEDALTIEEFRSVIASEL